MFEWFGAPHDADCLRRVLVPALLGAEYAARLAGEPDGDGFGDDD
jgi:hypothetical protein